MGWLVLIYIQVNDSVYRHTTLVWNQSVIQSSRIANWMQQNDKNSVEKNIMYTVILNIFKMKFK